MSSARAVRSGAFAALRRFARTRVPVERCELCGIELTAGHRHLIEPERRRLLCACEPCAFLFSLGDGMKYRRVPQEARGLPDFQLSDAQWDDLRIPISVAFFFRSGPLGRIVALYPSPAGPTESLLPLETWNDVTRDNPRLLEMEADVEALLVNRLDRERGRPSQYYIVPIDQCFRLVGLIRMHWKGFSGGTAVWDEIDRFFDELGTSAAVPHEAWRA